MFASWDNNLCVLPLQFFKWVTFDFRARSFKHFLDDCIILFTACSYRRTEGTLWISLELNEWIRKYKHSFWGELTFVEEFIWNSLSKGKGQSVLAASVMERP